MSENQGHPMGGDEPRIWREERRARREERREARGGSWIVGVILIVLGVLFLLQNQGIAVPGLQNWWALFILLPAASSLTVAWRAFQHGGIGEALGALVGGLVLVAVALTLLFEWSWGLIGPLLLVLAGVGLLLAALFRR